jgi:DNA-binding response OmpR family regulator
MRKNVLIVEDNPVLAMACAAVMEDDLGCATFHAVSVQQARQLMDGTVDLALLDIEVADGLTFSLAVHLLEREIPTIFMSGADPARVPAELVGVPFLRKPVLPSVLVSAARCYL